MELIRNREEAIINKDKDLAMKYQEMLEKLDDKDRAHDCKRSTQDNNDSSKKVKKDWNCTLSGK